MRSRNLGLLFLFVLISSFLQLAYSQKQKPNIIFILADDLGYGDVGCYGQKLIKTPNIDEMATRGMRFTQFYAGCPVCAPSRSSLMTGQHTGRTPIRGNISVPPEGQQPLPASTVTIAELLKKSGYTTGDFGKWGLGFFGTEGDPNKQGFDQFYGYNDQSLAHNYFPAYLWENDKKISLPNTPANPQVYAADLINQKALEFIDQNKSQPFFLYLSYTLPHAGLQLPANDSLFENYRKQFNEDPKEIKEAWNGKGYAPQAYPRAAYAAMVSRLDVYVGQVMNKLKALNLDKNTLVIFSSDNGPHREGGNDPAYFNSSGGFRGIKRDVYEGGIREPMIAAWPGTIKAGTVSNFVGAFWDFLPTFCELAGQKPPADIDGISIVKTLKSQRGQLQHPYLYWEFHEQDGKQGLRMGNWKAVRLSVMKNSDPPIELYDLNKDPFETTDLAKDHPEIVKKAKAVMQGAHVENKKFPFFNRVATD